MFDALTLSALRDEFRTLLVGGRVQAIVQTDDLSIGLEIYAHRRRHYLLASAQTDLPYLYRTGERPRRGVEGIPAFLQLLRKYLRGARLLAVEQPPFERVLHLVFSGPTSEVTLSIELMGRHSNLILIGSQETVLDAVKRVPPTRSRVRPILPGRPYRLPPPQPKLDPTDLDEDRLHRLLVAADPQRPAWLMLVNGLRGISPLLAREIVSRALGDPEALVADMRDPHRLLDAFEEALIPLWEHDWSPCVVRDAGEVIAFAPIPLTHLGEPEPCPTISQAAALWVQARRGTDPYAAARAPLQAAIEEARRRIQRRMEAVRRATPSQETIASLREKGQWILTYAHAIRPGQTELVVDLGTGEPLTIPLDPHRSPSENAQRYFREYEKAKRAAAQAPQRLEAARQELAYLDQLATDLALAEDRPAIDAVALALQEAGYLPPQPGPRPPKRGPLRITSPDGFLILVGRNARQNDQVTFKLAGPDDLWLHARGVPGAHVVIKSGGQAVPETTLQLAATLAAYYSTARGEAQIAVDVTERKRVRRLKGHRPGMVTYRGERTLWVKGPALPPISI